jgi:hypothetical protein
MRAVGVISKINTQKNNRLVWTQSFCTSWFTSLEEGSNLGHFGALGGALDVVPN